MTDPNNPPAFPNNDEKFFEEGMSLRDYFAAAALTGMVANGYIPAVRDDGGREYGHTNADYARKAYELASAMLKARES